MYRDWTPESQPQPPEPPFLDRDGFTLYGHDFGTPPFGEARVEASRLLELFYPERMPTKREQKATALEAKELLTNSFYWSQLKWYGIKFKRNESLFWLRKKLSDAVQLGKCDTLPASLIQLEQDMRRELAPELKIWDEKMKVWNAARQAERDGPWARCETPAEQAEDCSQEFRDENYAKRLLPKWRRAMKSHEKLVNQMKRQGPHIYPESISEPRALQQGRGAYIIRCKEIDTQWPFFLPLTIRITHGPATYIAVGEPEFGYFRGTMFLAMDDAILAQYLEEDPEDIAAVADEEEAEADPDEATGSKRKHAPSEAESAPNKKTKGSAHRVVFRMRTSQTGTESNKGHFDFSEDLTTFTGEMEVPWVNGRVKLEGYKYSDREMPYVDTWDHYEPDAPIRRTLAFIEALEDYNVEPFS
ncbi:hypothetical protein BJ166DRAFT_34929 [Pestalotiopsis sp. NC0098]|nr:hypothetical protein BJ166DRAFT_34929 [Pestalotiopsis sp. NC0098]